MPVDLKLGVPIMCACMHVCASVCSMQISAEERWESICVSACMRTYVLVYVRVCECKWMAHSLCGFVSFATSDFSVLSRAAVPNFTVNGFSGVSMSGLPGLPGLCQYCVTVVYYIGII